MRGVVERTADNHMTIGVTIDLPLHQPCVALPLQSTFFVFVFVFVFFKSSFILLCGGPYGREIHARNYLSK